MKKIITIFTILMGILPVAAQHIIIEKNDNSQNSVAIEQLRKITFNGTTVNLIQNDGTTIENQMDEITRAYFDNLSNIAPATFDTKELIQFVSSDEIAVNCTAGKTIALYNINGSLILSTRQTADGGSISVASLPKGVYLIRVDQRTAKFIKR